MGTRAVVGAFVIAWCALGLTIPAAAQTVVARTVRPAGKFVPHLPPPPPMVVPQDPPPRQLVPYSSGGLIAPSPGSPGGVPHVDTGGPDADKTAVAANRSYDAKPEPKPNTIDRLPVDHAEAIKTLNQRYCELLDEQRRTIEHLLKDSPGDLRKLRSKPRPCNQETHMFYAIMLESLVNGKSAP